MLPARAPGNRNLLCRHARTHHESGAIPGRLHRERSQLRVKPSRAGDHRCAVGGHHVGALARERAVLSPRFGANRVRLRAGRDGGPPRQALDRVRHAVRAQSLRLLPAALTLRVHAVGEEQVCAVCVQLPRHGGGRGLVVRIEGGPRRVQGPGPYEWIVHGASVPDMCTRTVVGSPEGSTKIRLSHPMTGDVYAFGPYSLDVEERRLCNGDEIVPLAPKAFDVLVALVRRAGTLVTKRELLDLVWRDVAVEEGVLSVYVSALRKSLGESVDGAAYIETVPRAGYRFWARVTHREGPLEPLSLKWPIGVLPARADV